MPPQPTIAPITEVLSYSDIKDQVDTFSRQNSLDKTMVDYVVSHESDYNPDSVGDLNIICRSGPKKGLPVYARGLMQLTRCFHPEISDEEAHDVVFSLNWSLPYLRDKTLCEGMWSTCRDYYRDNS